MKKTYIKPTTEAVTVVTKHMIAASGIIFNDDDLTGSGSLNDSSADDGIEALSRSLFDF